MTDLESLSRRLQTLEGRFRMMKAVAVITCIIVAGLVLMGQAPSPLPPRARTIRPLDPLPEGVQTRQSVENEVRARTSFWWTIRGRNVLRLSVTMRGPYSS